MEIDTGSEFIIVSEYVFQKLSLATKIQLEPITCKLATFYSELLKVKGSCLMNGQYPSHTESYFVKGHCPILFSLNWFESLGINLSGVHQLTSSSLQLSEVLRKY
ncbi:hypothetical protein T4D_300 [Trichinella pseudospiralis]|uniref:Peptidase A2 domain-containing protein n=1 Tax=Trichinella pseudospiralis TaxID=6337 RepID=A0A0V1FL45_TRIPS|nr:hypothetical protein T4D_300 [Trichinella pseudospiralis]